MTTYHNHGILTRVSRGNVLLVFAHANRCDRIALHMRAVRHRWLDEQASAYVALQQLLGIARHIVNNARVRGHIEQGVSRRSRQAVHSAGDFGVKTEAPRHALCRWCRPNGRVSTPAQDSARTDTIDFNVCLPAHSSRHGLLVAIHASHPWSPLVLDTARTTKVTGRG